MKRDIARGSRITLAVANSDAAPLIIVVAIATHTDGIAKSRPRRECVCARARATPGQRFHSARKFSTQVDDDDDDERRRRAEEAKVLSLSFFLVFAFTFPSLCSRAAVNAHIHKQEAENSPANKPRRRRRRRRTARDSTTAAQHELQPKWTRSN